MATQLLPMKAVCSTQVDVGLRELPDVGVVVQKRDDFVLDRRLQVEPVEQSIALCEMANQNELIQYTYHIYHIFKKYWSGG